MSEPDQPATVSRRAAPDPARAGRDALLAFVAVAVLVTGLVRINVTLPWIGHVGSALVSVLFLYVPLYVANRRHEDLADYGFRSDPLGKSLAIAGVAIVVIIPLFTLVFLGFYDVVCRSDALSHLAPHRMCSH